jgi:GntR family transcriptional regulator
MDAPYRRLAAVLRQRLNDGTYPPGSLFPSVRSIAREHGVGLGAAYGAVALLREDGLLEGEPRRRLTVAHPVKMRILDNPDADWPHETLGHGKARVRAPSALAARLGVDAGTTVTRERFELLDSASKPAMLLTTWRRGRRREHVTYSCQVRTHQMVAEEAHMLGLAVGTLALLVERTRTDAAGSVIEVADLVLPADRWTVAFDPRQAQGRG